MTTALGEKGKAMSRYIDADALKEWLDEYLSVFKKYDKGTIKGFVDHAPSIDIVRCKDCKYAHMTYGGDCKYCDMWKDDDDFCIELYLDGDFYCSYGERKER